TGKEATREASEQCSKNLPRRPRRVGLGRLQDGNAVLSHFNEFSENCFAEVAGDFSRHTRLLRSMKSDLEYIFQKLSSLEKFKIISFQERSKSHIGKEKSRLSPVVQNGSVLVLASSSVMHFPMTRNKKYSTRDRTLKCRGSTETTSHFANGSVPRLSVSAADET
ncbi:hypothetical protein Prudu_011339, partial [Prunus dulcis]